MYLSGATCQTLVATRVSSGGSTGQCGWELCGILSARLYPLGERIHDMGHVREVWCWHGKSFDRLVDASDVERTGLPVVAGSSPARAAFVDFREGWLFMTRLTVKHGRGYNPAVLWDHVLGRKPFVTGGKLRAVVGREGSGGRLPEEYAAQYRAGNVVYTVFSYGTPIAWSTSGGGWVVPAVSYSRTTTVHQGKVRSALVNVSYTE